MYQGDSLIEFRGNAQASLQGYSQNILARHLSPLQGDVLFMAYTRVADKPWAQYTAEF